MLFDGREMYVLCFNGLLVMIACMTYTDNNKCNGQSVFNGHNGRNDCNSHDDFNLHNVCKACDVCNNLLDYFDVSGLDTVPRS